MLAVKFYHQCPADQKPAGIPDEWPWETRLIQAESEAAPDETPMDETEYAAYLEQHRPAYSVWEQSQIPPEPNYSAFRLGIYQSPGYQSLVSASFTNPVAAHYLQLMQTLILSNPQPETATMQLFWSQVIGALLPQQRPTELQIQEWNQIAQEAAVPIAFDEETGLMREA